MPDLVGRRVSRCTYYAGHDQRRSLALDFDDGTVLHIFDEPTGDGPMHIEVDNKPVRTPRGEHWETRPAKLKKRNVIPGVVIRDNRK